MLKKDWDMFCEQVTGLQATVQAKEKPITPNGIDVEDVVVSLDMDSQIAARGDRTTAKIEDRWRRVLNVCDCNGFKPSS